MNGLAVAALAAVVATFTFVRPAAACGFDLVKVAQTARDADRIVLGTVSTRFGQGLFSYTIRGESVIKGGPLPENWSIRDAGASDCGMPRLDVGERVVLEYYDPGRITTGPWFYAWKINRDGTVAFSDSHQPPLPKTLDELLARYAAAALPPDTATEPLEARRPPTLLLLTVAGLLGLASSWRRFRPRTGSSLR